MRSALPLPRYIAAALTMVGQQNGLARAHKLCSLILIINQSVLSFYLIAAGTKPNDASLSYSLGWNRGIYTMVAIVSICMGDIIDHGPWSMSQVAHGHVGRRVSTYLQVLLGRYLVHKQVHTRPQSRFSIILFPRGREDYILIPTYDKNWREYEP